MNIKTCHRITTDIDAEALLSTGILLHSRQTEQCKICAGSAPLFDVVDFNCSCAPFRHAGEIAGVPIYYHRCNDCGFVFTRAFDNFDGTAWRRYIYNDAYFELLDPAYKMERPRINAEMVNVVCNAVGRRDALCLDYGGGNGVLAKLLSEKGLKYFTHDPYDLSNVRPEDVGNFSVLSSFEVLEHTTDPLATLKDMMRFMGPRFVAVVSTQCSEGLINFNERIEWSYVAPRHGHVSIYSKKSLSCIASRLGINYVSVSRGTHLFSRDESLFSPKLAVTLVKVKQRLWRK